MIVSIGSMIVIGISDCYWTLMIVIGSMKLLESIPEQQRQGDLPTAKTLGVCWNIADDTFSFKIELDIYKAFNQKDNFINGKLHL